MENSQTERKVIFNAKSVLLGLNKKARKEHSVIYEGISMEPHIAAAQENKIITHRAKNKVARKSRKVNR